MKKKIIISLIVVLILLIIGGGLFWWQKREIKGSRKDYVIKETPEGVFVENKKAGLTMKVPEGWRWHILGFQDASLYFESPDIEGKQRYDIIAPPFKKGCGIESTITYKKTNFDKLIRTIRESDIESGIRSSELEITTINNRKAIKNIFDVPIRGLDRRIYFIPSMGVYFIQDAKVFWFVVNAAPDEKERCFQEFNKFLETVSIK